MENWRIERESTRRRVAAMLMRARASLRDREPVLAALELGRADGLLMEHLSAFEQPEWMAATRACDSLTTRTIRLDVTRVAPMSDRALVNACVDECAKAGRAPVTPADWTRAEDEARERQAQAAMADHDAAEAWREAGAEAARQEAEAIAAELAGVL